MADFPALPLWTDAYLADTRHLSTLEHGAYLLLLMEAWRRPSRSLPDDDRMLARLSGLAMDEWEGIRDTILSFWVRDGRSKTWSQKRLSKESEFVTKKSRSQKDKAAKRWNKDKKDDATAMPEGMPERCPSDAPTPTPTPTPILEKPDGSSTPIIPQSDLLGDPEVKLKAKPKAKKAKPPDEPFTLPNWIPVDAWNGWVAMRIEIKKPPTRRAMELAVGDLEKLKAQGHDPSKVLDQSTMRNWQGLFPVRSDFNGSQANGRHHNSREGDGLDRALDKLDAGIAEWRSRNPESYFDPDE